MILSAAVQSRSNGVAGRSTSPLATSSNDGRAVGPVPAGLAVLCVAPEVLVLAGFGRRQGFSRGLSSGSPAWRR